MFKKKIFPWILSLTTLLLFLYLLWKLNIVDIIEKLKHIHIIYFFCGVIYAFVWRYLHAIAFYFLCNLKQTRKRIYLLVQVLSNTISDIVPVGNTGGEMYRAYKMSSYYPQYRDIFIQRVIFYNIFYAFAIFGVLLFSSFVLFMFSHIFFISSLLTIFWFTFLFILLIILCVFVIIDLDKLLIWGIYLFKMLPSQKLKLYLQSIILKVNVLSYSIKLFYRQEKHRVLLFIFLMFLSRILTIGEVFFFGLALGVNLTVTDMILINMMDGFIKMIFFMVPNGQLGVLEFSMVSVGKLIGQNGVFMLSLSLLQRARTIIWCIIGILCLILEKLYKRKNEPSILDA